MAWSRQCFNDAENSQLPIRTVIFEACHEGPLSWKLSDEQKSEIEADWTANRQAMAALVEMYAHPESAPLQPYESRGSW
jgi:hypothetical protein